MKTLFLSDLDGTFLNSKAEISQRSAEIIDYLIKQGVLFTVATARTHATVMKMFSGIPLPCPLVLMNGVTLFDPYKKEILSCSSISTENGNRILSEFRKRNVEHFYDGNR